MHEELRSILESIPASGEATARRNVARLLASLPDAASRVQLISATAEDGAGSSLHFAIRRNCRRLVSELLEQGASTATVDSAGDHPLHLAAGLASYDICQLLIDFGANLEASNKAGETALALAARRDFVLTVRVLVEGGANANCSDVEGWTPLHRAANGGYSDLCELLLSRQADAKTLTSGRGTPQCAASIARLRNYQDLADRLEVSMDAQTPPSVLSAAAMATFDEMVRNNPSDRLFLESLKIQMPLLDDIQLSSGE